MENCYRLFTIDRGEIRDGAEIKTKILDDGSKIPIIMIGDEKFIRINTTNIKTNIEGRTLVSAEVKRKKSGEIEFVPEDETTDKSAVVILKTELSGDGNDHTGDCIGWECTACGFFEGDLSKNKPDNCPKCGRGWHFLLGYSSRGPRYKFAVFPGEIIASECITVNHRYDGTFWSKGKHIVAIVPKGIVFRVHYKGVFGRWTSDAYKWSGRTIHHEQS